MERIILDVDTGHDDAVAIEMAASHPGIRIEALIAVNGNSPLHNTLENTLNLADALGIQAPVFAGSPAPLLRSRVNAPAIHGENGFAGPVFGPRNKQVQSGNAVEFIIRTVMDNPGQITFVSVGPYTDLALALRVEPRLAGALKQIVVMGGTSGQGNVTPNAEFNIFADPEAAQIVLSCGAPIVMMGLDCTLQTIINPQLIEDIRKTGGRASEIFCASMGFYAESCLKYIHDYPAMHDPCCIAYLIKPQLFSFTEETIEVDTKSELNYGRTSLMWKDPGHIVRFARRVDREGFFELMRDCFRRLKEAGI